MKEKIKIFRNFMQAPLLLFRKKLKAFFRFKLSGISFPKVRVRQRKFVVSLFVILVFTGVVGISYGAIEYKKLSDLFKEVEQLTEEEKYDEAITKLNLSQVSWFVKGLGIKKQEIANKQEEVKKLAEELSKYNKGLDKLGEESYQEAINLFSEIPEKSFYYKDAQLKIEEAKRKIVEEQLRETELAREKAEQKAQEEVIRRSQAEMEKRAKELELAEKEARERMMNADNDGDGLTYRRELELGTSDWDTDSDGDGIQDGEDAHPAGGGRYIAQHFEWEHEETVWTLDYSVHEDWYEYYKNKPRSPHGTEYVTPDDPFIKKIAKALKKTANKENYHLTSFIVSFVQGLPYIEDYYTSFDEYPKYPIETFVERNGDCEDTSYLFASIVQATGIGTVLIEFSDHMGVGIKTAHDQSGYYYPIGDDWYYYYETTGEGWMVGELPKKYLHEKAKIIRVRDGSVHYIYPKYIKPCYASSEFPGYYYDGNNYYSDSRCRNLARCMPYEDLYYNPKTESFYWDSDCNQIVVKGCYKSTIYPGYFTNGISYYSDSRCIEKVRICRPSSIYSDRYWDGEDSYWDSNCTQRVVPGCDKSVYYPGLFFDGSNYYYDYQCTQVANP